MIGLPGTEITPMRRTFCAPTLSGNPNDNSNTREPNDLVFMAGLLISQRGNHMLTLRVTGGPERARYYTRVRRLQPPFRCAYFRTDRARRGPVRHSVRPPGFVISAEVLFGMPDQRLSIRHDAGSTAR